MTTMTPRLTDKEIATQLLNRVSREIAEAVLLQDPKKRVNLMPVFRWLRDIAEGKA